MMRSQWFGTPGGGEPSLRNMGDVMKLERLVNWNPQEWMRGIDALLQYLNRRWALCFVDSFRAIIPFAYTSSLLADGFLVKFQSQGSDKCHDRDQCRSRGQY
jgi:hypothetical protein